MKRLLLPGLLAAVVVTSIVAYTQTEEPHSFTEVDCRECHVAADRNPKVLTDSETLLCKRCHRKTIRASSHPVDVVPMTVRIPTDLPLRDGKITCSTCHNIHAESRLVFGIKSYFLRRPTSDMKFFCIVCHKEDRRSPGHKDLITTAHMGSRYRVTNPSEPLDPLSIQCIGCHDGSIGPTAGYTMGAGIWMHRTSAHPIGVHYRTALMRGGGLAPVSRLNRSLRFFAGKIGCGTCHDMYSRLSAKLVMKNNGSRLCRACHFDK